MKRYLFYLFLSFCFVAFSENEIENPSLEEIIEIPFFKELESTQSGEGKVNLYQDERLLALIKEKTNKHQTITNQDFILLNGYRVQVYSSNTPKKSRSEAADIELKMKNQYPNINVYLTYTAPFWKVRMGDCKNYQDATILMNQVKSDFPNMRDDIYIVKEENIRIQIQ